MALLEYLKMLLLNFDFVMIYIIHKILVLLKNYLNYLKEYFRMHLKEYNKLLLKKKNQNHNMMENSRPEEKSIIKDINLFR